jgi:hypothetical protein
MLYEVQNKGRSWMDVNGGFSRSFSLEKHEGETKSEEKCSFKYDIGDMEATYDRLRNDNPWRTYHIPLTGKALDPLAAVYYLRGLSLHDVPISREKPFVTLPICADRRLYNTGIFAVGRTFEDVGDLKNRECLVIEPRMAFKGLFERKSKIKIYVDVLTCIPLRVTVEIPIGSAEAVLTEYVNSPLPSKDK